MRPPMADTTTVVSQGGQGDPGPRGSPAECGSPTLRRSPPAGGLGARPRSGDTHTELSRCDSLDGYVVAPVVAEVVDVANTVTGTWCDRVEGDCRRVGVAQFRVGL